MTVVLVVVAVAQMQVPPVQEELEVNGQSQLQPKLEACYLLLLPVLQVSAAPSVLSPGVAWSWQLVAAFLLLCLRWHWRRRRGQKCFFSGIRPATTTAVVATAAVHYTCRRTSTSTTTGGVVFTNNPFISFFSTLLQRSRMSGHCSSGLFCFKFCQHL